MRDGLYERVEELSRMRAKGLIDEAEFRRAKAAVLNMVPDADEVGADGRTAPERLAWRVALGLGVVLALAAALALVAFAGHSWLANAVIVALACGVIALHRSVEGREARIRPSR
jgi:cytochrome c-type biogenesis protein CcmH/NrfG